MKVSYKRLFKLLIDREMKKGELARASGISAGTLAKLAKNEHVNMEVLVKVCTALEVDFADIMELVPEKD